MQKKIDLAKYVLLILSNLSNVKTNLQLVNMILALTNEINKNEKIRKSEKFNIYKHIFLN